MLSEDVLDFLWPAIQDANMRASSFSRVPREMFLIMPAGTEYPCTDKGTIIRGACYKKFEIVIKNAYQRFESPGCSGRRILDTYELQDYLLYFLIV